MTPIDFGSPPDSAFAVPGPSTHNLIAWTGDPATMDASVTLAKGTLYLAKIPVPKTITVGSVGYFVHTAGVATLSDCYVGLHNSSGAPIGVSADMGADLVTTGLKLGTFTPVTVPGGPNEFVFASFLLNGAGTIPILLRSRVYVAASTNLNLAAADGFRYSSFGTSQTSIPTAAPGSQTSNANAWFLCLGA